MKPTPAERDQLRAAYPAGGPVFGYRDMLLVVEKREPAEGAPAAAPTDERIAIALSSETPVLRYDWWADEMFFEVLDHAPASVDLTYAADGLPFVTSHRAWDADAQHGLVEDVTIDADRRLRGRLRVSRAVRSQEIGQDIRDGIRKKVSIGYIVGDDYQQTAAAEGDDGIPTRRYTSWMPVEASTVPIPADYAVGVDRARSAPGQEALARFRSLHPTAPRAKERIMDPASPAPAAATPAPSPPPVARAVDDNTSELIARMATLHGFAADIPNLLRDHRGETAFRTASQAIMEKVEKRAAAPAIELGLDLKPQEARRYSYARVIAAAMAERGEIIKIDGKAPDDGFEREIEQDLLKRMPTEYKSHGGRLVPTRLTREQAGYQVRAGLDSATSTKGVELKFTQPGELIEFLRARLRVRELGARILSGLTGPVSFPRQVGTATHYWVGENPGSDVADSNLLLGTVALAIKTLTGSTSFSRQLLVSALSASVDAEALVRDDLAKGGAVAIDAAAIAGLGSSNQPRGVINTSGIGSVAGGTNGAAPTYAHVVDLETAVASVDGDIGTMAYLTTPAVRGMFRKTLDFTAAAAGKAMWTGNGQDGELNGYKAMTSNNVPTNLVKGTSGAVCDAIIFGVWEQLLIGEWGAYELIVDPYRLKKQGMIEVTDFLMADVAVRQTQAFAAMLDAIPT